MSLTNLAKISNAFADAASLTDLTEILRTQLTPLIAFDELIADLTSFELNRPALIRLGTSDDWTKRYNTEFFRLNPAADSLRALIASGRPSVSRFASLCREPLDGTRFYREYMLPQRHAFSLVAAMPLAGIGGVAPALMLLLVRKEGALDFADDDISTLSILLPALAVALGRIVRSSADWAAAVVKHAFGLPPKLAEVALLVAEGLSNQDLADKLGITLGTAKHYVHKLLDATGAASRANLCRLLLS